MELYKTSASYGVIGAFVSFLIFIALYSFGLPPYGNWSWLTALVPPVIIIMGTIKIRTDKGGHINYGGALVAALVIVLLYSSAFDMMAYLFTVLVDTDGEILASQKELAYQGMEAAKGFMNEEMLDKAIEGIEKMTIGSIALNDFFTKLIGWGIFALIAAIFLKKKDNSFEGQFTDSSAD